MQPGILVPGLLGHRRAPGAVPEAFGGHFVDDIRPSEPPVWAPFRHSCEGQTNNTNQKPRSPRESIVCEINVQQPVRRILRSHGRPSDPGVEGTEHDIVGRLREVIFGVV